jgi:AAA+ ATPase superfamily predicted ATPase
MIVQLNVPFYWRQKPLLFSFIYKISLLRQEINTNEWQNFTFGNACTKSGPLRFSQFSGCWLILSVCWHLSLALQKPLLFSFIYKISLLRQEINTNEWQNFTLTHNRFIINNYRSDSPHKGIQKLLLQFNA